jgi:PAS domain S-box-containing protein
MTDFTFVESIFVGALEMPTDRARAAFLDEACGQDVDLRRHVERLVAAHPRASSFPRDCRCRIAQEPNSVGTRIQEPPEAPTGAADAPTLSSADDDMRALQALVEGSAGGTGQGFFRCLVRHLAEAIDVPYAVVAEFTQAPPQVRTLAFWDRDRVGSNFEHDVTGTPWAELARGGVVHYPTGVSRLFPRASLLVERGIDSCIAMPLCDHEGTILGHLAVFDERPLPADQRRGIIFRIFAARAAIERERMRAEQRLRESETRYRDLFENAPNPYLIVGTDGRIEAANRRVTELFGYPLEELVGAPIHSFLPDTPAGRSRSLEVSRRHLAGESVAGWEMEMRRKDGRPLWIKMWMESHRGPEGAIQPARSFFFDITDRVLADQERARLQEQNRYLQEEIKADHNFEQIIGRSTALQELLALVAQVAPTDASVLITGETGTGKELIARAIHSASKRKDRPLIKVNCAALPAGLVESELFGHEKGAFSGAIARRLGRFELAEGGTIFLDEVGELAADAQAKLLRVLQERELDRVGGAAPIRVDVRVIAATNRNLLQEVQDRTFREDLFYRLNVFPLHVPPLRERRDDIPLLVHFLVNQFALRIGKHLDSVGGATMQRLLDYPWPGNVRELENVLERAVILATGRTLEIGPGLLPSASPAPGARRLPAPESAPAPSLPAVPQSTADQQQLSLEAVERNHILTVLRRTSWVITGPRGASSLLGLPPSTLRNRMKKLGIVRDSHHSS